eukprot:CAMPEP_0179010184 /NCGR_PEP_ID=MMETSP0795-20121207/16666_1 /TAXON_ID=88552 /ORGANISM="Amoebophrya sp., Strain Ameob2" /LENGTH=179 /DNA_ID=CAMNT_0020705423 /DNA_START=187 /DNA_END=726 /DNA_ORIENTATION=-
MPCGKRFRSEADEPRLIGEPPAGFSFHTDPKVHTLKGVQYKRAILLMMSEENNQNAAAVAAQVFAGATVRAGPEKLAKLISDIEDKGPGGMLILGTSGSQGIWPKYEVASWGRPSGRVAVLSGLMGRVFGFSQEGKVLGKKEIAGSSPSTWCGTLLQQTHGSHISLHAAESERSATFSL